MTLTNACLLFADWWTSFWRSSCGSCGLREVSIGWLWKGEGHYLQKHPSSLWHPTLRTLMPSQSPWRWPQLSWRPRARIYPSGAVSTKQRSIAVIVTIMCCEGENSWSKDFNLKKMMWLLMTTLQNLFYLSTESLWLDTVITQICSATYRIKGSLNIYSMSLVLWRGRLTQAKPHCR